MPSLTLLEIHNALATAPRATSQKLELEAAPIKDVQVGGDHKHQKTLQAVKRGQGTSIFHETLHEYSLFARPATAADVSSLFHLVNKLIQLCGTSGDSWKVFVLTVFLRRYHEKAPEAKKAKLEDDSNQSVGDGERLVFYGTLLELHHFWNENQGMEQGRLAGDAAASIIRITAQVGGTRDLCSFIEHLTLANLKRAGLVDGDAAPESFADRLVPAVKAIALDGHSAPDSLLELTLRLAAQQLDQDLLLLCSEKEPEGGDINFISTIHVMIPHNQRGRNTRYSWKRKMANSLAEIMIWQRTDAARKDVRFHRALGRLKALPSGAPTDQMLKLIQQIQTSARKQRKLLNSYARKQGFMLSFSSYQMDKTSLTLGQIRRAKVGDLKQLEKLARKDNNAQILKLIAKRHMDPDKATAIESIQELASDWVDIFKDYDEGDEIAELELAMQTNTIQATLKKLQCKATRPVLVACVGLDQDNIVCAILVASSLENSRLVLAGEEHDVSTIERCLDVLNLEFTKGKFTRADPMSLEDILAKLEDSQDAIILSSRDLELDEKALKDLQARDITLRVHATKKAAACGDIEISLSSAIFDRIKAREPLSLCVVLDCTGSMGGEIEGCKKGALKLISTFRELAPVQSVNVMGYWDPVNVRSDPQPKSTGFLDTADRETSKALQEFVDTQLVCQGGGDEPEDIPKALEHLLDDMKKKNLSADRGVHMVFFIADAGFRANENARVQRTLDDLKKLGTVLVMCQVRSDYGSLNVFVNRARDCFQGAGQYIELNGVGQLASIASSVTESIRASLFQSSVVSVTASIGSTLDSIRKLVSFQEDHLKLKETAKLAKLEKDDEEMDKLEVFASKEFALTSRDRLYLQLSRLPAVCHLSVGKAFGGKSLKELSAAAIADRIRTEGIPLAEVKKAGFPDDVVDLVRDLMSGFGIMRVTDPPKH